MIADAGDPFRFAIRPDPPGLAVGRAAVAVGCLLADRHTQLGAQGVEVADVGALGCGWWVLTVSVAGLVCRVALSSNPEHPADSADPEQSGPDSSDSRSGFAGFSGLVEGVSEPNCPMRILAQAT